MFKMFDGSLPASMVSVIGGMEDMYRRLEEEEADRRRAEADLPDSYLDVVPVSGRFGTTGLVRHALLRTGLSLDRLEQFCLQTSPPGTLARLAAGDTDLSLPRTQDDEMWRLRAFVNISRAVETTFSLSEIDSWWKERRHGKRYSPEKALVEGKLRGTGKVFDAYEAELTEAPISVLYVFDASFVESPHRIAGFTIPR